MQHIRIFFQDVTLDLLNVGNFAFLGAAERSCDLDGSAKGVNLPRFRVDALCQLRQVGNQQVGNIDLPFVESSSVNQATGDREYQYRDSQGSCRRSYLHERTESLLNLSSI
ncbi:MAG: hypothetical protein DMG61_13150 [Acidobacteria bacterium]|nr:MAG: hypothetical protein DMG61_13150 [Acidobacteriota bacterium]